MNELRLYILDGCSFCEALIFELEENIVKVPKNCSLQVVLCKPITKLTLSGEVDSGRRLMYDYMTGKQLEGFLSREDLPVVPLLEDPANDCVVPGNNNIKAHLQKLSS